MNALATAALCLGLVACTSYAPSEPRLQAPVPAGSTLVLERELEVVPGRTRVYLQDGRVLAPGSFAGASRFRPRCWFRVSTERRSSGYTIRPDRFRTGEMRRRVHAVREPVREWTVAAAGIAGLHLGRRDRSGPSSLTHELVLPLRSDEQSAVRAFGCQVDHQVGLPRRIGLYAVEQAIDGIARIELPD